MDCLESSIVEGKEGSSEPGKSIKLMLVPEVQKLADEGDYLLPGRRFVSLTEGQVTLHCFHSHHKPFQFL